MEVVLSQLIPKSDLQQSKNVFQRTSGTYFFYNWLCKFRQRIHQMEYLVRLGPTKVPAARLKPNQESVKIRPTIVSSETPTFRRINSSSNRFPMGPVARFQLRLIHLFPRLLIGFQLRQLLSKPFNFSLRLIIRFNFWWFPVLTKLRPIGLVVRYNRGSCFWNSRRWFHFRTNHRVLSSNRTPCPNSSWIPINRLQI